MSTILVTAASSIRKSITVRASQARAFQVFTSAMDSWWPRSHHIGSSPMKRVVLEGRVDGKVYSEQEDGTTCPWGTVLAWDPPHSYTMAWQVTPKWHYEPDLARCSEVEVQFTPQPDGQTLVVLEHRHFERHGEGWETMAPQVDSPGGWNTLLELFRDKAEAEPTA